MNIIREKQQAQGFHYRCADAPDTSGMNRAAEATAALSKEQLDWAKELYNSSAPDRAATSARAAQISDAQLDGMRTQTDLAKEYADYQRSTFRPLEQGLVGDAQSYDTTARRDGKAAEAIAGVEQQGAAALDQQTRAMSRRGVNPNSGQALAMGNQNAISLAAAKAGAASKARDGVEVQGYARRMDAANLGRGLASSQATSAGLALNAGNSSANNQAGSLAATTSGAGIMQQGFNGASSSMAQSGNIYGNIAGVQNQSNQSNNGVFGALGSVAGAAIFKSDKNMKEKRKAVEPDISLAAMRKTPVESWKYKAGSAGDDGGKTHTGPMAQDVRKNMGDSTAPGGKVIDMISMSGHQTNAIKSLDKTVRKIDQRLISLENARSPAKRRA